MSWDKPPDGYALCFVRPCGMCGGYGILTSNYCAADDMPGPQWGSEKKEATARVPCPDCIRGFQFVSVNALQALQHLLEGALKDSVSDVENPVRIKIRRALHDLMIAGTEDKMTGVSG